MKLTHETLMTHYIGTTFTVDSQWHVDEIDLISSIKQQIEEKYPNDRNLFINTTWFGPQFNNGEYLKFQQLVQQGEQFDRLILLAAADPVFMNADQINELAQQIQAKETLLLGHFDSAYQFNFHSVVLQKYFYNYTESELLLSLPEHVYLNYNRKPRGHRIELVNLLVDQDLTKYGVITLGKDDGLYSQGVQAIQNFTLNEKPEDYAGDGNWGMPMTFGIPHDIHSLGNMNLWCQHFLTVVSETEFFPWDNTFVSEKTWKPIIGLRPFIINGQTKIYSWLRNNGFKTFNQYWNTVEMEDVPEYQVHDSIARVIKTLSKLTPDELMSLYKLMLPDLVHNRERFFEFAREQKYKMEHLFK